MNDRHQEIINSTKFQISISHIFEARFFKWNDRHAFIRTTNEHAGRLDMSAETAHGIPKFERAPLMIPHGK